jgi:hypothetical protein
MSSQDPITNGVKGATPKGAQFLSHEIGDPPHHLVRGFVGEGQ